MRGKTKPWRSWSSRQSLRKHEITHGCASLTWGCIWFRQSRTICWQDAHFPASANHLSSLAKAIGHQGWVGEQLIPTAASQRDVEHAHDPHLGRCRAKMYCLSSDRIAHRSAVSLAPTEIPIASMDTPGAPYPGRRI